MKVTLPEPSAGRSLSPRLGAYAAAGASARAGRWQPQLMPGSGRACNPGCICISPYGCPCCQGRGADDPLSGRMAPWSW